MTAPAPLSAADLADMLDRALAPPSPVETILARIGARIAALMAEEDEDDVLVLDDTMIAAPDLPLASPEEEEETQPQAGSVREPGAECSELPHPPTACGGGPLPLPPGGSGEAALAELLAHPPPSDDFRALDLLYACWPRATILSTDQKLMDVARNLTRNFGLPGRLPMASSRAWKMLDTVTFEPETSDCLAMISRFVDVWHRSQENFLILDFGEIELIEYLFESLHPGRHASALVTVMNFKVLSSRRLGLLRRVPNRMRRMVEPLVAAGRTEAALVELGHAKALLRRIADPLGFAPVVEAAVKAEETVDKIIAQVAAPAGAAGGATLGA